MTKFILIATFATLAAMASNALGQFASIDQARAISASTSGTAGPTDTEADNVTTGTSYNNSESASLNFTDTTQTSPLNNANPIYTANGYAGQTSVVSATNLSGSGSVNSAASIENLIPGDTDQSVVASYYKTDFTVSAPTPITVTGNLGVNFTYHVGTLPSIKAEFNLTGSSAGQIYDVLISNPYNGVNNVAVSDPLSFQTTLLPGQTYTITAYSNDTTPFNQSIEGTVNAAASFNFAVSVPEPACGLSVLVALSFLRRRRV